MILGGQLAMRGAARARAPGRGGWRRGVRRPRSFAGAAAAHAACTRHRAGPCQLLRARGFGCGRVALWSARRTPVATSTNPLLHPNRQPIVLALGRKNVNGAVFEAGAQTSRRQCALGFGRQAGRDGGCSCRDATAEGGARLRSATRPTRSRVCGPAARMRSPIRGYGGVLTFRWRRR